MFGPIRGHINTKLKTENIGLVERWIEPRIVYVKLARKLEMGFIDKKKDNLDADVQT